LVYTPILCRDHEIIELIGPKFTLKGVQSLIEARDLSNRRHRASTDWGLASSEERDAELMGDQTDRLFGAEELFGEELDLTAQ
jgi:hypothetical protein